MSSGFVLRVEGGDQAGQVFPLAAPSAIIGRHTEAEIVLNDGQVSRRHAQVELHADRAILTDLNSANGTFVNGRRLAAPQPLTPGDLIQVGESRLRVEGPSLATQIVPTNVADNVAATQLANGDAPVPVAIEAGSVLAGRYRLERLIGQGGFARVFLANDLSLKRPIAVKVMNVESTGEWSTDDFLARFANEAQAIANLDHPNILAIHDYGQLATTAFLVMPYVSGGTLSDTLRSKGKLAPQRASRYLRQMAAALDYAHRRNLVHRDIKPQNMLVRADDDHLLLSDFGIAKILSATSAQSRTGVVGTIAYMAPEQFRGEVSRATDIYALGCVLFQMLTGKLPFGGSTEEVIYGHISAPVPLLADFGAELPPAVQTVVSRALAKRPDERFASAGELVAAFDAALAAPAATVGATATLVADALAAPTRVAPPPPPIAGPPPPPPPQAEMTPRQYTRLAELDRVPERKPIPTEPPPATSLTIPAVLLAILALFPAAGTVLTLLNDASVEDVVAFFLGGNAAVALALWFIRAAALQRTSPARASAIGSLLWALAVVLPSVLVAAGCILFATQNGYLLFGIALILAVTGPLIVPQVSEARPVGPALAWASALVLVAFGLTMFPFARGLFVVVTSLSESEAQLPAALTCLVGVVFAILWHYGARHFFPRFGRWAWLVALVLGGIGIALGNPAW